MMIEIQHLRKEYKGLVAVDDLCMELDAGDIFAFLGPNGAGKTTTIKMLATLLEPTSGTALVNGVDVRRDPDEVRSLVGYMPDFFGVYDDVKVWEYLDFFAAAYKVPKAQRPAMIDGVLELTDLSGKKDSFVEALSRGMKQRLCLARTLVHDPKVLLLDEPASGLDPHARAEIKELLRELRTMGKTIIVSSHILPELADFCNKVGIIEQGKLLLTGDVRDVVRQVGGVRSLDIQVLEDMDGAMRLLQAIPGVADLYEEEGAITVQFEGQREDQHLLITALVRGGYKVLSFRERETNLEQVFLKVTKGAVA
jgi:ABC-2 type transport system ATP-binding protein